MNKKDYTKFSENSNNKVITTPELVTDQVDTNVDPEVTTDPVTDQVDTNVDPEVTTNPVDTNVDINVDPEVTTDPVDTEVANLDMWPKANPNLGKNVTDELLTGKVANCKKLNVRKEPVKDSEVLCVIEKDFEVGIDLESIDNFYKVYFSKNDKLFEGYCVKDFIEIK